MGLVGPFYSEVVMGDQNSDNMPSEYWRQRHAWWKSFKKKYPNFIKRLKLKHPELFLAKIDSAVELKAEPEDSASPIIPEVKSQAPAPANPTAKTEAVKPIPVIEDSEHQKSVKRIERRQTALLNLKLGQIWEISGSNLKTDPQFVIVTDCDSDLKKNHKGVGYWEVRVVQIDVGDPFHFIADGDLAISADDKFNPFPEGLVIRLWNEHRILASDLRNQVTEISYDAYFFSKLILKPQLPTPQQSQIATLIEWGRPPTDQLWEFRTKKYMEMARMREKFSRFENELVKVFKITKVT